MNADMAVVYNAAIDAALREHHKGIGAIKALRKNVVVTVQHIGTTTKQDVQVVDDV